MTEIINDVQNQDFAIIKNFQSKPLMTSTEIMRTFRVARPTFNKWRKTENFPKSIRCARSNVWISEQIMNWFFLHMEGNELCDEFRNNKDKKE